MFQRDLITSRPALCISYRGIRQFIRTYDANAYVFASTKFPPVQEVHTLCFSTLLPFECRPHDNIE